jgi:hypothetical protein
MTEPTLISAVITGGIGAAAGGVITAIIQVTSRRGESRAKAADLVAGAAGGLATQQANTINRLDKENDQLRAALLSLSITVEDLLPYLQASPEVVSKAREALRAARLV